MRVNPSLSSHANAASSEDRLPEGRPSSALPPTRMHVEVLSNHPTCLLYINPSGQFGALESAPVPRSGRGGFHQLSSLTHSAHKTTLVWEVGNGGQKPIYGIEAGVHGHGHGQVVQGWQVAS